MTDRIETTIEDEAALHEFVPAVSADEPPHCTCGEWCDSGPSAVRVRANFNQHQALAILDALKAARIAVVELPRGNADWRSVDWQPVTGWDLAAYKGQIHIDEASNEPLSPHEARALAAALLAAAEASQ